MPGGPQDNLRSSEVNMSNQEPLTGADDVAARLGVTKQRVYDLAREGIIPHVRLGRSIRFAQEDIEDFVRNGGKSWVGRWRKSSAPQSVD